VNNPPGDRPEDWSEIFDVLDQAFDLPGEQQKDFVRNHCAGRPDLLAAVESLLEADRKSGDFLRAPAAELAAGLIAGSEEPEAGSIRFGPFRTSRMLGYGGMGVVYLAERSDGEFEQQVAIKCMRGIVSDDETQQRFRHERQILARLQHPSIAHLLDGGVTENGHPYFAMEYVDGSPLTDYCDQQRLRISERIVLFLDVCAAVSYAHSNLVIHRDLKPSNILVVSPETGIGGAQVKLLDFGIAKLLEEGPTAEGAPRNSRQMLTLDYAAPEQLLRHPITAATDVYALGLLLHELLSGSRAHRIEGQLPEHKQRIICEQAPAPPSAAVLLENDAGPQVENKGQSPAGARRTSVSRLRKRLRGDLDAIVLKALQKKPGNRYSSVEAMAEDLRRYLDLQTVKARDGSLRYRMGKFLYRYRWGVSATALILLLLAGLTGITLRSNIQIRSALETARIETARAQEIAHFLQELIEVADPFAREDEVISINELLNRGAERISQDLTGQPETQSELMFELARIHNSLGLFARSAELLEQTLAIQQQLFGAEDPEIARTFHWQSIVADNLGEYGKSEEKAEAALEMRVQLLPGDDPDVGESMDRLGSLLAYTGQKDRALALAREAVDILDNAVGEEDKRTQTARHNLAWMLGRMGRYEEATPVYEQVIEVAGRVSGREHPETLETLNNFAVMLRHQGEIERAEQIYRQVLSARLRLLGNDHPQVGFSQNNLAKLLQDKGEYEEASDLYALSLVILRTRYGDEHTNVAISLGNLAQVLFSQGRMEEAETRYRESLEVHRKSSPSGSVKLASTLLGLGHLLTVKGDITEAEPLLREALSILQQELDAGHWETAVARLRLGQLLSLKGDVEQARVLLQQSSDTLTGHFGEDHRLALQAREAMKRLARDDPF
jgi:serine/threonine-protein kinase